MRSNTVHAINRIDEDFQRQSQIEIRDHDGFKGVFATEDIEADSVVFYLKGTVTAVPNRYTIQLGRSRHLNFPAIRRANDDLDYCWQYLNHGCEPNGVMNTTELTFRALRDIKRGEEITFNYLTTESVMTEPFNCLCGSANCFGFIRGRNFLSVAQARRLSVALGADHLVTLYPPLVRAGGRENSQAGRAR